MASLACADLFVGLIVMPVAIVQLVYGDFWPFGKLFCDLWHSIDVFASTASILDLCVIALDRYSAIRNPILYHRAFFVQRWPFLLAIVWLCSGKFKISLWLKSFFSKPENFVHFLLRAFTKAEIHFSQFEFRNEKKRWFLLIFFSFDFISGNRLLAFSQSKHEQFYLFVSRRYFLHFNFFIDFVLHSVVRYGFCLYSNLSCGCSSTSSVQNGCQTDDNETNEIEIKSDSWKSHGQNIFRSLFKSSSRQVPRPSVRTRLFNWGFNVSLFNCQRSIFTSEWT